MTINEIKENQFKRFWTFVERHNTQTERNWRKVVKYCLPEFNTKQGNAILNNMLTYARTKSSRMSAERFEKILLKIESIPQDFTLPQ